MEFQLTTTSQAKRFGAPVGTWIRFRHKMVWRARCPVWETTGQPCSWAGCEDCDERDPDPDPSSDECPGCETGCDADFPHRVMNHRGDWVYHPGCATRAAMEERGEDDDDSASPSFVWRRYAGYEVPLWKLGQC